MEARWKKSSRTQGANNCVEVSSAGAVRDSKNPAGPVLRVNLCDLLDAIKEGRI
ncbi:DUF397 domain-containing protein [Actinophytocola sp.]|uniref:DUF397 domain-containing protein n=1 Tax=Actinophytocola sp. TaxID=1872138 RepID=UPI002D7F0953|nr:DUF397 domain-containing protein [Actinophytocola sp.]HET9137986.1 DUF397 domain-containing protein [Actinophytocola sp.]